MVHIQPFRLVTVLLLARLVVGILSISNREDNVHQSRISLTEYENTDAQEILALHELYLSTSGDEWTWYDLSYGIPWNFTANCNPCGQEWQGVTCKSYPGSPHQHITGI